MEYLKSDILQCKQELKELNQLGNIKKLVKERSKLSIFMVILCWFALIIIVCISFYSLTNAYYDYILGTVLFMLFGVTQRGIGNLLHDGSHGLLHRNRVVNNFISEFLLAIPMGQSFAIYKNDHLLHHRYLGDSNKDVDYIHNDSLSRRHWIVILFKNSFRVSSLLSSLCPVLMQDKRSLILKYLAWWLFFLLIVSIIGSTELAIYFFIFWHLSKITIFHFITIFREISDHFGLEPGGIFSFTRNCPTTGVIRFLIHPFNNGYHLTHHLFPNVSWYNLPKAHKILLQTRTYSRCHVPKSYFLTQNSLVNSWRSLVSRES